MENRHDRKLKFYEEKKKQWEAEMTKLKYELDEKFKYAFPDLYEYSVSEVDGIPEEVLEQTLSHTTPGDSSRG